MRRLFVGICVLAALGVTGGAIADDGGPRGCSTVGSFFGYTGDAVTWIASIEGQSSNSGTLAIEATGFDVTLGNHFPTAVTMTTLRGIWKRVDGNTFTTTVIGLALDSNDHTVWIGKLSDKRTLAPGCNSGSVTDTKLEVFLATQNPFADSPLLVLPLPDHDGHRMTMNSGTGADH